MAAPENALVEIVRTWQDMAPCLPYLTAQGWFPEADPSCLELDGGLMFFVCRDSNGIRAMLGAKVEETEIAWRLGTKVVGHSRVRQLNIDYGRVWGDLDTESARTLVTSVQNVLAAGEADVARFGYIAEGGALHQQVRKASFLFRDHFPLKNTRWRRTLPESYDALLHEHSKTTRKKLKSIQNRLKRTFTLEYRCWTQPEELDQALHDVAQISGASYQQKIGAAFEPDELALRKLRLLCERGALRIYVLYLNGRPAAFYMGYLYGGVFWGTYTGFDDEFRDFRVGTSAFHFVLEDLCGLGSVKVIDFGLGDSGYKEVYASEQDARVEILLFRHSWQGARLMVAKTLTGGVRTIAYALLERTGLLQRLKTRWRRRVMAAGTETEEDTAAATQ